MPIDPLSNDADFRSEVERDLRDVGLVCLRSEWSILDENLEIKLSVADGGLSLVAMSDWVVMSRWPEWRAVSHIGVSGTARKMVTDFFESLLRSRAILFLLNAPKAQHVRSRSARLVLGSL